MQYFKRYERGWDIVTNMIENKKIEAKGTKEVAIKLEVGKIAETLGKYSKMRAKNGDGDKSRMYGH